MVKPQDPIDLVVEADGNQREHLTEEALRNRSLLKQTVEAQVNQMKTCASTLEGMRANLNRLQAALAPLETDLVQEQSDAETVDGVHRLTIDGEDEQTVEEPAKAQPKIQGTAKTMCAISRSWKTRPSRWTSNRQRQPI